MNANRQHLRSPRWLWIAFIVSGIGLFDATNTVFSMKAQGMHHDWPHLFWSVLLSWLLWVLITPLAMHLGRAYPLVRRKPLAAWVIHLAAYTSLGVAGAAWNAWLEVWLNPLAASPPPGPFIRAWFNQFHDGFVSFLILYATVLAVGHWMDSQERLARQQTETARLNEQLSKAQLEALRRQIEPHFLFNTLNAIAGMVREKKNDDAVSMIAELSEFLRRTLADSTKQHVPLGEEMEFLQKYLAIQKVRFAERLQLSMDVPHELLAAQVPSLILQPLVENAVKHGISKRAQGGLIRITASRSNGMLTLNVYNDGPSLPAEPEKTSPGIGISNMRTRLQSLYGTKFELGLQNQPPGGVKVSVSVPFREE